MHTYVFIQTEHKFNVHRMTIRRQVSMVELTVPMAWYFVLFRITYCSKWWRGKDQRPTRSLVEEARQNLFSVLKWELTQKCCICRESRAHQKVIIASSTGGVSKKIVCISQHWHTNVRLPLSDLSRGRAPMPIAACANDCSWRESKDNSNWLIVACCLFTYHNYM